MQEIEQNIKYSFKNKDLLTQALTHKSYHHEREEHSKGHNERLEFLGDAVLDLSLSVLLMREFSECSEGDLSKMRASLVNERVLAELAQDLGLHQKMHLGKGEVMTGGCQKPRLLACVFEALVGAVFLDGGYREAERLVWQIFQPLLAEFDAQSQFHFAGDYKSRLQERAQELFKQIPVYVLRQEEGPDHNKTFYVEVRVGGQLLATGEGRSKKIAEQEAAQKGLEKME